MPEGGQNIQPMYPIIPDTTAAMAGWPTGGAAANTNSATPGAVGTDQYWLPIWSGEVLHAYDQYNIFEPMVTTETITSGTTKRFPITGTVGIKGVWSAGEELLGDTGISTPGYFDVSLDSRPMAAFFELDDIHLLLTQWDYRAELARQAGLALANTRDKQIACMIAQAAFTVARAPYGTALGGMNSSSYSGGIAMTPSAVFNNLGNRGTSVTDTDRANAALLLLRYIENYMVNLQEQDVTGGEVYCVVTPTAFHDIRALGIARDATALVGGAGRPFFGGVAEAGGLGTSLSNGLFGITDQLEYMGVKICKSNHLSQLQNATVFNSTSQNITPAAAGSGTGFSATTGLAINTSVIPMIHDLGDSKYNFQWAQGTEAAVTNFDGNGSGAVDAGDVLKPVKALIWQRNAVCSMRLQGMKVETVKDIRRGTNFTVASIMGGAGILRPELCAAIQGNYTVA